MTSWHIGIVYVGGYHDPGIWGILVSEELYYISNATRVLNTADVDIAGFLFFGMKLHSGFYERSCLKHGP